MTDFSDKEKLSGALQENILTLLCFDDAHCKIVRASLTPQLFDSAVFREVAGHAIDFIDQFGVAIKEHLPDSLEHILNDEENPRKAANYKALLENLLLAKDSVNAEYVVASLHKFIRQQNIKSSVIKAVEALEDGRIDEAEVELQRGLNTQVTSFELGTALSDTRAALTFMENDARPLLTGIEELDRRGIGLEKKTQFLFMAPAKKGKTWFAVNCGKWALLQRQTVLHISLEMSESKMAQRYLQAFFSISKKDAALMVPKLRKDDTGHMIDVAFEKLKRDSFEDPNIRAKLAGRMDAMFKNKRPLIIKEFPPGYLTIEMLEAYLDGLERFHKIVPDVVIIDYPDLMAVDAKNLRTSLGEVNKKLRGLAVKRNHAQLILSQSNKEGAKAKMVDATHAAEDWSKIATADNIFTYSQTLAEQKIGLARLFAAAVRGDEGGFVALITQAYAIGQFCLDSCLLSSDYWDFLEAGGTKRGRPDDDEDD